MKKVFLVLFTICVFVFVSGTQEEARTHFIDLPAAVSLQDDPYFNVLLKRSYKEKSGGMWFGPRLGRKKRSLEDEELADSHKTDAIVDILKYSPWAVIAVKGGRKPFSLPPRHGRESEESEENDFETRYGRNPPFSPRLGRLISPSSYSPRLVAPLSTTSNYVPRLGGISGLVLHP